MSKVEITIPTVGESVTEANIGQFLIADGTWANKGDAVFEIETDKASMEITAPESGLVSYSVGEGDLVQVGATVGQIDTSAEKPAGSESSAKEEKDASTSKKNEAAGTSQKEGASAPQKASKTQFTEEQLKGLGPAKRKAAREGKLKVNQPSASSLDLNQANEKERKPMSVLRKKIAERLLNSQHSTASLTTFNELDMTQVMSTRSTLKADFEKKHGVRLGFMSYFAKAVCYAAEHVPSVNAQIEGSDIVYNKNVHISVAVSTERGLVVPVLRNVNQMSYAEIESGISELATRARDGKLGIEDMSGGTFTITNGGVFGSLLSTPILNPPQSAILGMHKIEQRPMAIDDGNGQFNVEVRPMMYLALTYDHRLIDGKESVTFLVKAKEYLESVTEDQIL